MRASSRPVWLDELFASLARPGPARPSPAGDSGVRSVVVDEIGPVEASGPIHRLAVQPPLLYQGRTNGCGPHALAMAASCLLPAPVSAEETARRLRLYRVPRLGATLPLGLEHVGRELGLTVQAHWLGQIADLERAVDDGHPAIVLVHPDDFAGCAWSALHYRVVVGYWRDPTRPGGGELYFACSALGPRPPDDYRPGNFTLDYAAFARQWHTYLTIRWFAELAR